MYIRFTVARWMQPPLLAVALIATTMFSGCSSSPNEPSPTGAIAGTVLLSSPVDGSHAGITVYIPGTSYQARTAADGAYMITGLMRGRYDVMAEHGSAKAQKVGQVEVDPHTHTVANPNRLPTIILEPTSAPTPASTASASANFGSLRGFVFLEGIESSEGVRIRVEGTRFITAADPDGAYRFPLLDPGDYILTFQRSGYQTTTESVRIEAGRETVVGEVAMLRMDPDGSLVPPTALAPSALLPTLTTEPLRRETLTGNRSILGVIEILDSNGTRKTDFGGVTVAIENTDYVEVPDDRGIVRFAQLPAGVYRVLASLGSMEPQSALVDLTQDNSARVTFRFQTEGAPTEELEGNLVVTGQVVVRDENGNFQGVVGAAVAVTNSSAIGMTGTNGEFRLERAPLGSSTLLVTKEGFDDLAVALDMPEAGQNQLDVGQLELRPRVNSPRVISSFPLPGQSNVPVGMALPVILRFSRGMDPATLLPAVRVFPDSDFRLHLGPNSHPDSDEATLVIEILNTDDRRPIRFNTAYEVSVSTAATDREGNPLAETYTLNFRTGGFSVIATDPANGEQQAPFGASIGITLEFNTRLRPESVRDGNIQIRPRPDTSPQFSLIEDPVTGWTTVRILTRLLPNRQYSVTVGRGVRAANGAPLTNSPYRFTFRTRSDNSR